MSWDIPFNTLKITFWFTFTIVYTEIRINPCNLFQFYSIVVITLLVLEWILLICILIDMTSSSTLLVLSDTWQNCSRCHILLVSQIHGSNFSNTILAHISLETVTGSLHSSSFMIFMRACLDWNVKNPLKPNQYSWFSRKTLVDIVFFHSLWLVPLILYIIRIYNTFFVFQINNSDMLSTIWVGIFPLTHWRLLFDYTFNIIYTEIRINPCNLFQFCSIVVITLLVLQWILLICI